MRLSTFPIQTNVPLRISLLCTASLFLLFAGQSARGQGIGPHIGAGHLGGQSVGLDDGYTSFGAFLPLYQVSSDMLLFSDTHMLLYNEQTEAVGATLGLGARYYYPELNRIFGGYAYYDFRELGIANHHQVSGGFETLGEVFDARINVNTPTDRNVNQVNTTFLAAPAFGGPVGQNVVLGTNFFQQAFTVLDMEAGALLWQEEFWQVKGFAGAYGLFGEGVNEWGARGRLELRVDDQVWVNGFVQNDNVFGTTGGVSLEVRFGVGGNKQSSFNNVVARLGDPVQRRRHIAVQNTETDLLATRGGVPITVLHVDSNAPAGGTGGFMDPVNNLAAASNQPQDIVFVHGDSVFNGESMMITTFGQDFLGEGDGIGYMTPSDQGLFVLPGVNPAGARPQILNAPGSAVTYNANFVQVTNFAIDNAGVNGITGIGSGFIIAENRVTNSVVGINVGVNGDGLIENNVVTDNDFGGIGVAGVMTGDIRGNTASNNGNAGGILITAIFGGDIIDNIANENDGDGISLNGALVGNYDNNETNDNGGFGFTQSGAGGVTGNVVNNTANGNDEGGIEIDGGVIGNVTDNTTNNNTFTANTEFSGIGLGVNLGITGELSRNTANGNAEGGILVDGNVGGLISTNMTNNNMSTNKSGDGLQIDGDTLSGVFNNESNMNAGDGISILGQTADITFNTTNQNSELGLFVAMNVSGAVTDNEATGNTGVGMAFADLVGGTIARNNASNNMQDGMQLFGNASNDIDGNFFNGNANNGLIVIGTTNANVTGNEANGNMSDNGMRFLGDVNGNITGNTTNLNNIDGIRADLDVNGDVTGNTANNNGDDGIDVEGTITGASAPNNFSGNGDQGLEN